MDEVDLQDFSDMFLEECRENVDVLERGLLSMGEGDADDDLLNEVFRAAHSIKGGGATFGFLKISELTHWMETLLDEMRSHNRAVRDEDVELLLVALDMVRELMDLGAEADHPDRLGLQKKLADAVGEEIVVTDTPEAAVPAGAKTWNITFRPQPDLMSRGNDPLLLLRETAKLGEMHTTLDLNALPEWEDLDPKACHMSWTAELHADVEKETIAEIFEWIEFDCDLVIEAGQSDKDTAAPPAGNSATPDSAPVAETKKAPKKAAANTETASIRVATDKIDQLINLVGELVITQSMLDRIGSAETAPDIEELRQRLSELDRNTRELQESVMQVRMLPMSSGFGRLPRLVRDLSRKLEKQVELVIEGGSTEIDKTVLERLMDPLVHLVRNSLDHGLEPPDERLAAGKSETGQLTLSAYQQGGAVIVEIIDDGRGINRDRVLSLAVERGVVSEDASLSDDEICALIFAPGFSTADEVSDVSGRGVGMDVVRRNIQDLGGRVDIKSPAGKGTTVSIRLPLTLAILEGQLVRAADQVFVIPLLSIVETIEIDQCQPSEIPGAGNVCRFRERYLPLVDLAARLGLKKTTKSALVAICDIHGHLIGLEIDEVLGQQQVVIKALEDNFYAIPGVAGATIMSDGSVALILDPPALAPSSSISAAA